MKKSNDFRTFLVYIMVFVFIVASLIFFSDYGKTESKELTTYNYDSFIKDVKNSKTSDIKSIDVRTNEKVPDIGYVIVSFKNGYTKQIEIPSVSAFMQLIHTVDAGNELIKTYKPIKPNLLTENITPIIITGIVIMVIFLLFSQQSKGGGGGKVMSFGKSKHKVLSENSKKVTFADVAGLKEEKEDLEEIVTFLKEPAKFQDIGARIPKGILLVGPPGTGKTLLARAIAGEAGVQFFNISGSDFVEMFVGVGASRVRDMFEEAKKNKPCLIFIDEIDAVGRKRGSGLGGGHDEREQTLNQLLVEMDGFTSNENIIIIAATNRVDILDPALLRPGRFDRQVYVGAPDVKGRKEILEVHAKSKKFDKDVNLMDVAKITSGFTGAELENLLNEAAILAAKKDKKVINSKDISKAFIKVGIGTERKSRIVSNEEKLITAYHEAGHAIVSESLYLIDKVHLISIIPTGSAGGYTMHLSEDKGYLSKKFLLQRIMVLFGGRIAEELIFDDITSGASSDIETASNIARVMISNYGMSSLGPIEFKKDNISQALEASIDKEINGIIKMCYEKTSEILKNNMKYLHDCSELLITKEKITGDEFRSLFPDKYFPEKFLQTFEKI